MTLRLSDGGLRENDAELAAEIGRMTDSNTYNLFNNPTINRELANPPIAVNTVPRSRWDEPTSNAIAHCHKKVLRSTPFDGAYSGQQVRVAEVALAEKTQGR